MTVIYNKRIPFRGFAAINIFGLVFARREEKPLDATLKRHEWIHSLQMIECAAITLIMVLPFILLGCTLWLLVLPFVAFYILYLLGYLFRLGYLRSRSRAYRQISFEREAYAFQANSNRLMFGWLRFLFHGRKRAAK